MEPEVKQVQRPRPVKLRAIEVTLSDGQLVMVHEPRTSDMGTFLGAMPALMSIAHAFQAVQNADDGVIGIPVDIPPTAYEGVFPLIAAMTDISVEEFKELPLFDGLALMRGLTAFAPNPQQAVTS